MAANPTSVLSAEQKTNEHLLDLILFKKEAKEKIDTLEAALRTLKPSSLEMDIHSMVECTNALHSRYSQIEKKNKENRDVAQITMWNNELIDVIDKLQKALCSVEKSANQKVDSLNQEIESMSRERAELLKANESLKARVASEVLQKRWSHRIELAAEKIMRADQIRNASIQRLEHMEECVMEAHDDVYHVQRFDAIDVPRRDVCLVFHYVSNLTFPLEGVEDIWMNVLNELMSQLQRELGGHRLGSYRGMFVFVFQDPLKALEFSAECHSEILKFRSPVRKEPQHFRSIGADDGRTTLYRGPRLHTCIFSCTPEVTVDPVSGESSYFGPEVKAAVSAAFQFSPVGEIVTNKRWAQIICRRQRCFTDSDVVVKADAADVRESLGRGLWDVAEMPGAGGIVCSILPKGLKGRRSVDSLLLQPSPRFPCAGINLDDGIAGVVHSLKKASSASMKRSPSSGNPMWGNKSSDLPVKDGDAGGEATLSGPMLMMKYFTAKQEVENISSLYKDLQRTTQVHERGIMAQEDRFEISNRSPLDPSETAYVCTVDFGDDAFWKNTIVSTMTTEEYTSLRGSIRSYIHSRGKANYGFLMNGNGVDIFTYVFREVQSAFSFVSDVYIMVNRQGTKCAYATQGSGQDVHFLRAGIANGPMSSIYRVKGSSDNLFVKCTGAMIRLSGALCDLAHNGEILATDDVITSFLSDNENLLDAQFNIVKQGGQYLYLTVSPSAVHSILPKPFAYRRNYLMEVGKEGRRPSKHVELALGAARTEYSRPMVENLLSQQLERLEKMEACLMAGEDVRDSVLHELRNPWLVTTQEHPPKPPFGTSPNCTVPVPPLAFTYCNIRYAAVLEKSLPLSVIQNVYGKYNFFVQKLVTEMGGFVVKTNGSTAYMMVFSRTYNALEMALHLQKALCDARWPMELQTLEPSLTVKNAKTGAVLFHGPRVQIAVHTSNQYVWARVPNAVRQSAIDFDGPALDELYFLGSQANGGEIRFSRQCLEYMRSTSAKLLLHQMALVIHPSTRISNLSAFRASSTAGKSRGSTLPTISDYASRSLSSISKTSATGSVGSRHHPLRGRASAGRLAAHQTSSLPTTLEALTAVPLSLEGRLEFLGSKNVPTNEWERTNKSTVSSLPSAPQRQTSFHSRSSLHIKQDSQEKEDERRGGADPQHSLSSVVQNHSPSLSSSPLPTAVTVSMGNGENKNDCTEGNETEKMITFPPLSRRPTRREGSISAASNASRRGSSFPSDGSSKLQGRMEEEEGAARSRSGSTLSKVLPFVPGAPFLPPERDNWYFEVEGCLKELPAAQEGATHRRRGSSMSGSGGAGGVSSTENANFLIPAEARDIQSCAERLLSKFPPEFAFKLESNSIVRSVSPAPTPYSSFMRFSREIVSYLVHSFALVNDRTKPPSFPKIGKLKTSFKRGVLPQGSGPSSAQFGGISRIPSPPLQKVSKEQKNICSTALDYLDESLKFLSKLQAAQ